MFYEITGSPLSVLTCNLTHGESVISEGGAMSWMSPNMEMLTKGGGAGSVVGRMFAGESLFQNVYTANGNGMIAFAAHMPGEIRAINVSQGNGWIVQKKSFLACESSVKSEVFFRKKLGAGLFGGEGFIMQKISGNGTAFIEIDGSAVEYNLAQGQQIVVSTGFVAAMTETCQMNVKQIKGAKNVFFGGEGLFNTVITGPGLVILQSMPVCELAKSVAPYIAKGN